MINDNPYEPPKAKIDPQKDKNQEILKIAKGQKNIIYAILLNILSNALQFFIGAFAIVVLLIAIVLSIYGVYQISKGLGYSIVITLLLYILLLIPLINILTLLILNSRATAALRKSGYQVGLLGAKLS